MQLLIFCLALFSALAAALPTTADVNNGLGASLFSEQNYKGNWAPMPFNKCTNFNVLFPVNGKLWKARSIVVEKGMSCAFFVESGCPAGGNGYTFGSKDMPLGAGTLPEWLDRKIKSVYCAPV